MESLRRELWEAVNEVMGNQVQVKGSFSSSQASPHVGGVSTEAAPWFSTTGEIGSPVSRWRKDGGISSAQTFSIPPGPAASVGLCIGSPGLGLWFLAFLPHLWQLHRGMFVVVLAMAGLASECLPGTS